MVITCFLFALLECFIFHWGMSELYNITLKEYFKEYFNKKIASFIVISIVVIILFYIFNLGLVLFFNLLMLNK